MGKRGKEFFISLGEKDRSDLQRAAYEEAQALARRIQEEAALTGKDVQVTIESLERHPKVNPIHYLQKGVTLPGGYLVSAKED